MLTGYHQPVGVGQWRFGDENIVAEEIVVRAVISHVREAHLGKRVAKQPNRRPPTLRSGSPVIVTTARTVPPGVVTGDSTLTVRPSFEAKVAFPSLSPTDLPRSERHHPNAKY